VVGHSIAVLGGVDAAISLSKPMYFLPCEAAVIDALLDPAMLISKPLVDRLRRSGGRDHRDSGEYQCCRCCQINKFHFVLFFILSEL
jgi:hypothetical protein